VIENSSYRQTTDSVDYAKNRAKTDGLLRRDLKSVNRCLYRTKTHRSDLNGACPNPIVTKDLLAAPPPTVRRLVSEWFAEAPEPCLYANEGGVL